MHCCCVPLGFASVGRLTHRKGEKGGVVLSWIPCCTEILPDPTKLFRRAGNEGGGGRSQGDYCVLERLLYYICSEYEGGEIIGASCIFRTTANDAAAASISRDHSRGTESIPQLSKKRPILLEMAHNRCARFQRHIILCAPTKKNSSDARRPSFDLFVV